MAEAQSIVITYTTGSNTGVRVRFRLEDLPAIRRNNSNSFIPRRPSHEDAQNAHSPPHCVFSHIRSIYQC